MKSQTKHNEDGPVKIMSSDAWDIYRTNHKLSGEDISIVFGNLKAFAKLRGKKPFDLHSRMHLSGQLIELICGLGKRPMSYVVLSLLRILSVINNISLPNKLGIINLPSI